MPRLIVLNGPPGVGKSTLARRYVDDHPGVLALDIDQVARLIGGVRSPELLALARSDALALGGVHLRAGYDVLVPQYIGRVTELERFEAVAQRAGATFLHIVLMAGLEETLERFADRGRSTEDPALREIHQEVDHHGGESALVAMYAALEEVVRARLTSVLLTSEAGAVQQTYDLLTAALAAEVAPTPPRAVAVVVDGDRVLVILRRRLGLEYSVLPGGGVEPDESADAAALRELREETSLTARVERELWRRDDDGRAATYFLMTSVAGTPLLSGEEAVEHNVHNSFELAWVTAPDLDRVRLQPAQLRPLLSTLLRRSTGPASAR